MSTPNVQPSDFDRSLPIIFREEGGLANLVGDSGKLTNLGVTQATYDRFRDKTAQPRQSVRYITKAEASAIYLNDYWMEAGCALLAWPLCLAHFAAAVNMGPFRAIQCLQRALDLNDDGAIGPQTEAAIQLANKSQFTLAALAYSVLLQHVFYYDSLDERDPSKTEFLTNLWLKRIKHIYNDINKPVEQNGALY